MRRCASTPWAARVRPGGHKLRSRAASCGARGRPRPDLECYHPLEPLRMRVGLEEVQQLGGATLHHGQHPALGVLTTHGQPCLCTRPLSGGGGEAHRWQHARAYHDAAGPSVAGDHLVALARDVHRALQLIRHLRARAARHLLPSGGSGHASSAPPCTHAPSPQRTRQTQRVCLAASASAPAPPPCARTPPAHGGGVSSTCAALAREAQHLGRKHVGGVTVCVVQHDHVQRAGWRGRLRLRTIRAPHHMRLQRRCIQHGAVVSKIACGAPLR